MLPFSICCNGCGEYVSKGRKFNARKDTLPASEAYLGIKVYRFRIRCPGCAAEISYRTDPQSGDYRCESGARRSTDAPWREDQLQEQEEAASKKRLEASGGPDRIEALEKKAYNAKREIDIAQELDDIRAARERLERASTQLGGGTLDGVGYRFHIQKGSVETAGNGDGIGSDPIETTDSIVHVGSIDSIAPPIRTMPVPLSTHSRTMEDSRNLSTTLAQRRAALGIVRRPHPPKP